MCPSAARPDHYIKYNAIYVYTVYTLYNIHIANCIHFSVTLDNFPLNLRQTATYVYGFITEVLDVLGSHVERWFTGHDKR